MKTALVLESRSCVKRTEDRGEVVECFITSPNTQGAVSTPDMGSLHVPCSCIMNIVSSANYIYCSAWQCAVGTWAASFVATSIRKGFLLQLASHTHGWCLGGFKNFFKNILCLLHSLNVKSFKYYKYSWY